MPWTKNNYPDAMKNLPAQVREKSIEIANALLDERVNPLKLASRLSFISSRSKI
jgi:uncharacterized protein YdaT